MPVATMKNLFHLPVMSRNPGAIHPTPQTTNNTLSQSSVSMLANHNQQQDIINNQRSATLNGPLMGATSMGDIKQTKLSTIVSKKANRAKEMFLQNLGKAEKTKDELFEMYQANFYKQQSHALKLHKEIKNYIQCLKTMQDATRNLNLCLQESHGKESPRHDLFCENIVEIEQLYDHLSENLRNNVLANIEEYLGQFSEIREKISKRGRKLIDYDSAKRGYELVLAANNKKPLRDETRLSKSREQYEQARHMYQNLNNELHNELPALYESRIPYILLTLQAYCNTQINFHQTNSKLYGSCHDAIDLLATLSSFNSTHKQHGTSNNNNIKSTINNNNNSNTNSNSSNGTIVVETYQINSSLSSPTTTAAAAAPATVVDYIQSQPITNGQQQQQQQQHQLNGTIINKIDSSSVYCQRQSSLPNTNNDNNDCHRQACVEQQQQQQNSTTKSVNNGVTNGEAGINGQIITPSSHNNVGQLDQMNAKLVAEQQQVEQAGDNCQQQQQQAQNGVDVVAVRGEKRQVENGQTIACKPQVIPDGATTTDLPEGVLYKVRTSYKYMAEDVDELCFEADEILHVIEYEDPLEQEEGWLMGLREVNGQRGLFPANFTRVI